MDKIETEAESPDTPAEETKVLTKKQRDAQKKKLKEKQKKEAAAKEAAAAGGAGGGAKAKGKPMNAAAAAALKKKQMLEEARLEEEKILAAERAEEEEEKRLKEAEEAKLRAEADRKKADKKAKIDQMKKEGTYLSKKELAKKKEQEAKRAQLIADGIIKPEDEEEPEDGKQQQKPKKSRKKDKKKETKDEKDEEVATEDKAQKVEEQKPKQVVEEESKGEAPKENKAKDDSDDLIDDWEAADSDEIEKGLKDTGDTPTLKQMIDDDKEDVETFKEEKPQEEVKSKEKHAQKDKKGDKPKEEGGLFKEMNEDQKAAREARKAENRKRLEEARKSRDKKQAKMRCPIVCILGHVDTGKTLILDKLRKTNVQAGEAGGITQQIGATYFPRGYIDGHMQKVKKHLDIDLKLPGFLVIDTPGHESFTNLRSRGSSLCDIAILVVDLMHGLEQQTLESMELLRQKKCPFIIALNKIDRCYGWKSEEYRNVRDSLEIQESATISDFKTRCEKSVLAFAEQGYNACMYWENEDVEEFVSLCPTSAITGEGLPDLLTYLVSQCQTRIPKQLYERDEFECTTLEVKVIEGLGTTIDVVLLNGVLKVQDTIVLQGFNGPIVTQIRALLTPQPLKELRVKNEYQSHQKIKGAMGIKIAAPGLEQAIAGSEVLKANTGEEIAAARAEIEDNMYDIMDKYVDKNADGVCVQASTLGSLEALLEFLKESKIPVVHISIGPVHKKDVLKAMKILALEESKQKKEFATILAFDVKVTPEAEKFAEEEGIKIFTAQIIYHLFDEFTAYVKECQESRKSSGGSLAVWPCALEMVKDAVFNRSDPIIIGVNVTAGTLRIGTMLCVPEKENLKIGVVESIQLNKKNVDKAQPKDGSVAVRIGGASTVMFGRQFNEQNQICSWITRKSIDALKQFFRDEVSQEEWKLIKALKAKYKIE